MNKPTSSPSTRPETRKARRIVRPLLVVVLIAAVATAGYLFLKPPNGPQNRDTHFRDEAEKAGITFKMNFLPEEQGRPFKVNLYDHGSGVAVADYDGDGHDDIYLVNQLGRNALYRNKG